MADLRDLIDFIKGNPPSKRYWGSGDWKRELADSIADWTNIAAKSFENSRDWQKVESARPKRSYGTLCEALVGVIGLKLAERWCLSSLNDQEEAAAEWLSENLLMWSKFNQNMRDSAMRGLIHGFVHRSFAEWNLNPIIWNDIGDTMKSALLTTLFRARPGEPFRSRADLRDVWEMMALDGRRRANRVAVVPQLGTDTGYVSAPEVDHLRNIMQDAGDEMWLARLDDMISRREVACRNMTASAQRAPYVLNGDERELVARLLDVTRASGYQPTALPSILISSETPPIFIAYPDLENESDDVDVDRDERYAEREDRVPTNRERGRPETISIEELLGVYQPRHEQIVIYERGIMWQGSRYDRDWLRAVVLIHEVGHWIAHVLQKPGTPTWPTDLYVLADMDVHEGWAQLMTSWIAKQVGGGFMATFNDLNRTQAPPYHVFREFEHVRKESVMASLEKLRLLAWPARLQDWREAMR